MGVLLALGLALAGLSSPDGPPRCERQGETFHLSGRIDAELAACVRENFDDGVTEIVVNSPGGDADQALLIAERFEGVRYTLKVRGQCSSGCANLFLPLARRVVVEPGSYVVLHGTLDPQQLDREVIAPRARMISRFARENPHLDRALIARNYDAATRGSLDLLERMNDFTARNRIPPGWLFYREPGDRGLGPHVEGRLQRRNPDSVLVEEALMRSCLPHIEIEPYQAGLEASFTTHRARFESYRRTGGVRSGDLVCVSRDR